MKNIDYAILETDKTIKSYKSSDSYYILKYIPIQLKTSYNRQLHIIGDDRKVAGSHFDFP